jgi:hypothetical protein
VVEDGRSFQFVADLVAHWVATTQPVVSRSDFSDGRKDTTRRTMSMQRMSASFFAQTLGTFIGYQAAL